MLSRILTPVAGDGGGVGAGVTELDALWVSDLGLWVFRGSWYEGSLDGVLCLVHPINHHRPGVEVHSDDPAFILYNLVVAQWS